MPSCGSDVSLLLTRQHSYVIRTDQAHTPFVARTNCVHNRFARIRVLAASMLGYEHNRLRHRWRHHIFVLNSELSLTSKVPFPPSNI